MRSSRVLSGGRVCAAASSIAIAVTDTTTQASVTNLVQSMRCNISTYEYELSRKSKLDRPGKANGDRPVGVVEGGLESNLSRELQGLLVESVAKAAQQLGFGDVPGLVDQ